MCGIFGKLYFNKNKRETKMLVDCLNTLSHRGPDDSGIYEDKHVFLGSRRLSVIDLSKAGHMPMHNEKHDLWIIFNGEIFNYREIRKKLEKKHRFISNTDTEVVLHLFEDMGPLCLKELRGMFAFAIWNTEKKELFLARDPVGKKPLKYYVNSDSFIFASELKAILKDPSIPKEIDIIAIDEFLTYQYVPPPRTGFKNISKLEPAHYMRIKQNGTVTKKKYWEPQFLPKLTLSENELEEKVLHDLRDSVRVRLRSDVPLGAHLSGGIDSSLIVALMTQELNHPVETFSIGFEEKDYNELPFARLVAQRYMTDHHELIVKADAIKELPKMTYYYEEPFADPSLLPTWLLCKETKKEVTVALNGDGGDENFAGYQRYVRYKIIQYLHHLPLKEMFHKLSHIIPGSMGKKVGRLMLESSLRQQELYPKLFGCFGESEKNKYYSKEFKRDISAHNPYLYLDRFISNNNLDSVDSLMFTDIHTYLPEDLLVKIDIAGMAHSLEVRSPLLDHLFIETASRIPANLKLNGFESKYLLKKIAINYLPRECVLRSKQGFGVPLEYWLNNKSLKEQLDQLLVKKSLLFYFIREESLVDLLKKVSGDGSRLDKQTLSDLWLLLCLDTWLDVWFPQ